MPRPPAPDSYRAGDSDREQTAEILRQAAGDGRITLDELDSRLEATYAARTYADLAAITADLPPATAVVPSTPRKDEPLRITGTGGAVERSGRWSVPCRGHRRRAQREVRSTEPSRSSSPRARPRRSTAGPKYSGVESTVPTTAVPGRPHLVVTGKVAYGSLSVRHG